MLETSCLREMSFEEMQDTNGGAAPAIPFVVEAVLKAVAGAVTYFGLKALFE